MKGIIIILMALTIGMISNCTKDPVSEALQFESTGMIMGSDKGMCPCCGGWILEIDDDENLYRIEELPEDAGIELSETNLSVKFNWNVNRECSSIIYINIEDIELN